MGQAFTSASKKDALVRLDEKIKELEKEKDEIKQIEVMEPIKIEIECGFERRRDDGVWATHVEVFVGADIPPNLSENEARTRLMLGFEEFKAGLLGHGNGAGRCVGSLIDEYEDDAVYINFDDWLKYGAYDGSGAIHSQKLFDKLIKNGHWYDSGSYLPDNYG